MEKETKPSVDRTYYENKFHAEESPAFAAGFYIGKTIRKILNKFERKNKVESLDDSLKYSGQPKVFCQHNVFFEGVPGTGKAKSPVAEIYRISAEILEQNRQDVINATYDRLHTPSIDPATIKGYLQRIDQMMQDIDKEKIFIGRVNNPESLDESLKYRNQHEVEPSKYRDLHKVVGQHNAFFEGTPETEKINAAYIKPLDIEKAKELDKRFRERYINRFNSEDTQ